MTTPTSDMPFVSVVITAYNFAEFLPITLNSVLMQTYPNMEVILLDDGSTDDTADVVAPFTDRITYIQQENQGIVNTYNKGVSLATGKYICVLDGDDYWTSPDKIEKQVAIMEANLDIDFVLTGWQNISDDGEIAIFADNLWDVMPAFEIRQWLDHLPNQMQPLLLKRSVMNEIGGFNPFEYATDMDFFLSLVTQYKGTWLKEITTVHRIRSQSAGHSNWTTQLNETFKIFEKHLASETMPQEIRDQHDFFMFFRYLVLLMYVCRVEVDNFASLANDYLQQSLNYRWAWRDFDVYDMATYLGYIVREIFVVNPSQLDETLTHMIGVIKRQYDLPETTQISPTLSIETDTFFHWWLCVWWRYYHIMTPENRETPPQYDRILPYALAIYQQKPAEEIANLARLSLMVMMLNFNDQMIAGLDRFWHEMNVYEIFQTRDRHVMVMLYTTVAIRALYYKQTSIAMKLLQRAWMFTGAKGLMHWMRFLKALGKVIVHKLTGRA